MQIRILGCSGGISGELRTTSLLVDDDILIDAGTGVGDMTLAEMAGIRHIFVTHSHLDHIAGIPLMVDSIFSQISEPVVIHASAETIAALRNHIFNWTIWPDFTVLPTAESGVLRYQVMEPGSVCTLGNRQIRMVPVFHTVPGVGYCIESAGRVLAFTGDTTTYDPLWKIVNQIANLRYLIIETAFCNRERDIAIASKHLCPSLLAEELTKLERNAEIFITHLKPGEIELTMQEIEDCAGEYKPRMLQNNQVFEF